MSTGTGIEWTDTTWNPVAGCDPISPGCAHCYAATMAKRLSAMADADLARGNDPGRKAAYVGTVNQAGKWTGVVNTIPEALGDPIRWRKPTKVFVNSMSDLFHEAVPFHFVDRVFGVMAACQRLGFSAIVGHTFQILTKRPERMAEYLNTDRRIEWAKHAAWFGGGHNPDAMHDQIQYGPEVLLNVWLGTSVEDQQRADERIPHLLNVPAAVRFLSMEPLLDDVDISRWLAIESDRDGNWRRRSRFGEMPDIQWVIVGGESGHKSRPCNIDWIRNIVLQCQIAKVPVFVKQIGRVVWEPYYLQDDIRREWLLNRRHRVVQYVHHTNNFTEWDHLTFGQPSPQSMLEWHPTDRTGGEIAEWPDDLRVREFPGARDVLPRSNRLHAVT